MRKNWPTLNNKKHSHHFAELTYADISAHCDVCGGYCCPSSSGKPYQSDESSKTSLFHQQCSNGRSEKVVVDQRMYVVYIIIVCTISQVFCFLALFRELRDILKSLKPIIDVLMLLLFMMFIFALLGKHSFPTIQKVMFTY